MSEDDRRRLAQILIAYSAAVRAGDAVRIESHGEAAPLLSDLYAAALCAGAHPDVRIVLDEAEEALYAGGSDAQLEWVPPDESWNLERGDVWIIVEAPANTKRLTSVDPERMARRLRALHPLRARALERAGRGEFRWMICAWPTEASAQDAGMSLREFDDVLRRGAFLDDGDPIASWRAFGERLERVAGFLERARELRVVADGTDLRLGVGGRTWVQSKGLRNFPDGEVFTAPVETEVDGTIRFSYPAIVRGRQAEDVRLRFAGGEVVEATARRGEDFLREMIGLDEGARRVGEFAFGMNDAIAGYTGNLLLDEKIGGTVHLALGQSLPGTGGDNESALHWDIVRDLRDGGEVYADGELVYRDGRFLDSGL